MVRYSVNPTGLRNNKLIDQNTQLLDNLNKMSRGEESKVKTCLSYMELLYMSVIVLLECEKSAVKMYTLYESQAQKGTAVSPFRHWMDAPYVCV